MPGKFLKATPAEFHYRFLLFLLLYLIGFFAPWNIALHRPYRVLWSQPGFWAMRAGIADFGVVTLALTALALLCALVALWLRVWGSAYIGSGVVHDNAMHAGAVVAAGPYRYVRNPLYLGGYFALLSLTLLMPPSGAVFALLTVGIFNLRLIGAEEEFLAAKLGQPYLDYLARVPRMLPGLRARVPAGGAKPQWLQALAGETFYLGLVISFAAVAWQFNSGRLAQWVLVSLGVSIVVRGFRAKPNSDGQ